MNEKILVPVLGESITEATVVKWLKDKGQAVETDEPIVELETDKVNLEVPSPINGVISEITAKNGQVVEVGAVLGSVSSGKIETLKRNVIEEEEKIENNKDTNEEGPELFEKILLHYKRIYLLNKTKNSL